MYCQAPSGRTSAGGIGILWKAPPERETLAGEPLASTSTAGRRRPLNPVTRTVSVAFWPLSRSLWLAEDCNPRTRKGANTAAASPNLTSSVGSPVTPGGLTKTILRGDCAMTSAGDPPTRIDGTKSSGNEPQRKTGAPARPAGGRTKLGVAVDLRRSAPLGFTGTLHCAR